MDHDQSPDHPPPDHDNMAAIVANASSNNMPGPAQAPFNKRYRPAPAKTFQCRGYGDCRMVFSRSEHLARHIRKHTGERPFSCHCGKQFSRLDNLRQHAQTVHADKQEQNERMMRDLTSLHATMAAANKVGSTRSTRRAPTLPALSLSASTNVPGEPSPNDTLNLIKQEDAGSLAALQRQAGYESEMIYGHSPSWAVQANEMELQQQHHQQDTRRPSGQHSFRGDGNQQSFLAPQQSQSASFRNPYSHFDGPTSARPSSSSSRPPTSSGQSLPPLSAVVSASIPSPPLPSGPGYSGSSSSQSFPFPGSLALRRPGTAPSRPGTGGGASAAFFNDGPPGSSSGKFGAYGGLGLGLGSSSTSSLLHTGFGSSGRGHSSSGLFAYMAAYDAPAAPSGSGNGGGSPTGGAAEPSPFFFQPPALEQPQQQTGGASPSAANPRKRAFGAPDGPFEHDAPAGRESAAHSLSAAPVPTPSSHPGLGGGLGVGLGLGFGGPGGEGYEYGTESRPQSRRLSVMELCNDDAQRQQQANAATLASALAAANERERYAAAAASNGGYGGHGNAGDAAAANGSFLLPAAGGADPGTGGGGYGGSYGLPHAGPAANASGERPTTSSGLVSSASALHIFDGDSDSSDGGRRYSHSNGHGHASGSGSGSGSNSPTGPAGSVYGAAQDPAGRTAGGGYPPAPARAGGHSPVPGGAFYAASPALSGHHPHHHGHPTPTPSPHPGLLPPAAYALAASPAVSVYGALPSAGAAQQHPQQYAFAGSPTFSGAGANAGSVASYASPRSPISDGSGGSASPFSAYAQPQQRQHVAEALQQAHRRQQQQQQQQQHAQQQYGAYEQQQQQQQQYHHAQQYAGHQHAQQQQQQQRVSPVQYDVGAGAGYVYDAHAVQRVHPRSGHFQQQQQYVDDARYAHHEQQQQQQQQRYAAVGHGHGGQHGHDVRLSVSPGATPTFGMRV